MGAVTICVLVAAAAPAHAAILTLEARNDGGQPVSRLHAGESLGLDGTLAGAADGEPILISISVDGQPLRQRTSRIASGAFQTRLRVTRPGHLSVVAQHAGTSASLALVVTAVGHSAAGCQRPATLTRLARSHPPRVRDGPLRRGALLAPGARLRIPKGAAARLKRGRATYGSTGGRIAVECRAVKLLRGRLRASGRARVVLGEALARADRLDVEARPRRIRFVRGRGSVTSSADPRSRMRTVAGDTVLKDRHGLLRMDTWPFAKSPEQRRLRRDAMPPYWADGSACATGCRPRGALPGWPLKPFHHAHPLRAGLNEWRPANMHIGVDIQALDGTRVYSIQSGRAGIAGRGTVDVRVRVGCYEYWHVRPLVHAGQRVRAHRTVIGRILRGAGHLHLSELRGGYLNPLRPGGRVLRPYRDTEEPVIGAPRRSGGQVFVEAFDPQALRETIKYRTPVLAPAAVAWRARDRRGRALTALHFAYRGSHHYPTSAKSWIYGPGTTPPTHVGARAGGWACFWRFMVCVPRWKYRLPGVPARAAALSVYAWDWAGNVAARTTGIRTGRANASIYHAGESMPADVSPVD